MSVSNTHYGADAIRKMLDVCESIYFIGIGGINMSSLAHITARMGYAVGGSDRVKTALTERLCEQGINVFYSHARENAEDYDAFVYTVAIGEDNPEYVYARETGKPCISRADYLGYIMTEYGTRVGVSGMHGKSTCTSMCAQILIDGKYSPTVLSGAELPAMGGAYTVGESDNFVFEACEYMDSFLDFNPTVAVVLNIEMDHVDYFHSMEQIKCSYASYAALTGDSGYAVYNADDKNVVDALSDYKGRRMSFGIDNDAYLRAVNICSVGGKPSFDIVKEGELLCHVSLSVSGYHNIYNALAAAGACLLCGVSAEDISIGLQSFHGACRRMEYKGSVGGVSIYDDYAHHPTEISSTLAGAKALTEGKLFCIYQPHTYSRTSALLDEFSRAFDSCDRAVFVDIYAAREKNTFGISSGILAQSVGERASYAENFEAAARTVAAEAESGDVVIVMGAGDVYKTFAYFDFDGEGKNE